MPAVGAHLAVVRPLPPLLEFSHESHVIIPAQHPVVDVFADLDEPLDFVSCFEQQLSGVAFLLVRSHCRPMALETPQQGRTKRWRQRLPRVSVFLRCWFTHIFFVAEAALTGSRASAWSFFNQVGDGFRWGWLN